MTIYIYIYGLAASVRRRYLTHVYIYIYICISIHGKVNPWGRVPCILYIYMWMSCVGSYNFSGKGSHVEAGVEYNYMLRSARETLLIAPKWILRTCPGTQILHQCPEAACNERMLGLIWALGQAVGQDEASPECVRG